MVEHSPGKRKVRGSSPGTNCVYTIHAPRDGGLIPFFGQASRRSLPPGWLYSSQKRGRRVKSWPDDTHSSHLKQRNKPQSDVTTHWVHLKYTHIQQQQYKPDWRLTIHTPTQNVTTAPSTDNTTPHHQQTTHPLTNNNQLLSNVIAFRYDK